MRGIPTVKTWRLVVDLGVGGNAGLKAEFFVDAPTKRLAILNFRMDERTYCGYNMCPIETVGVIRKKSNKR